MDEIEKQSPSLNINQYPPTTIIKSHKKSWILGISIFVFVVILITILFFTSFKSKETNVTECNQLESWNKRFSCIINITIEERDPNICEILSNNETGGALRDNCYKAVAQSLKDYKICDKILLVKDYDKDNYAKENNYYDCRMFVSIELEDIDTCRTIENLNDSALKSAIEMDLDQKYIDQLKNRYRDWCTAGIALKKLDPSLCNFLPETEDEIFSKESCLTVIEQCRENPILCKLQ